MILWTFHPLLFFLLCSSPTLLWLFFQLPPTVWLILPQDKVVSMQFSHVPMNCLLLTRSECGLWVCRRNYSLSYFQLTTAAASMDKPSLNQLQGWAKSLDNEKKLWTGLWGNSIRSWTITEGLGFPSLLPYLWTEGKVLLSWAKNIKIKGSVDVWRLGLLNGNTSTHSLTAEMGTILLGCSLEFDCSEKGLNRLSFSSSCGCCFLCMFRVNT